MMKLLVLLATVAILAVGVLNVAAHPAARHGYAATAIPTASGPAITPIPTASGPAITPPPPCLACGIR